MGNNLSQSLGPCYSPAAAEHHTAAQQALAGSTQHSPNGPTRLPLSLPTPSPPHAAGAAVTVASNSTSNADMEAAHPLHKPMSSTDHDSSSTDQCTPSFAAIAKHDASYDGGSAARQATSSSSSCSSSVVSLSSRGFTNDETMPWRGSPHGSLPDLVGADAASNDGDADGFVDVPAEEHPLQCSLLLPGNTGNTATLAAAASAGSASGAGVSLVAAPCMHVGQLIIHPKTTSTAEQVVWVVSKQQVMHLQARSAAAGPALQLVSPTFALPCSVSNTGSEAPGGAAAAAGGVEHHQTIEWSLLLHPTTSSGQPTIPGGAQVGPASDGIRRPSKGWQLSLRASAVNAAAGAAEAAGPAWQLTCAGSAKVVAETEGTIEGGGGADFKVAFQQSSQAAALPLILFGKEKDLGLYLPDHGGGSSNSSTGALCSSAACDSDASSSRDQLNQQGQNQGAVAAGTSVAAGSAAGRAHGCMDELSLVITFSELQLLLPTNASASSDAKNAQQREQQETNVPAGSPSGASSSSADAEPLASSADRTSGPVNPDSEPSKPRDSTSSSSSVIPSFPCKTGSSSSSAGSTETAASLEQLAPGGGSSSIGTIDAKAALGPGPSATPTAVPGGGVMVRQLEAVLLSTAPRLLVIDDFFDAATCEGLMELARGKLVRSRVASGSETPSRTSWSHFFVRESAKHALIAAAEAQIEALFGCSAVRGPQRPLAKVEALQVVKYHEGEFYHEHYDNRADSSLTRAATIIVYLCDTEHGGSTSFPRATLGGRGWHGSPNSAAAAAAAAAAGAGGGEVGDAAGWHLPPKVAVGPRGVGIKVFPVRGRAVVFWSKRPDGSEDPNSIHAAETVLRGEKWIATRWMKDA